MIVPKPWLIENSFSKTHGNTHKLPVNHQMALARPTAVRWWKGWCLIKEGAVLLENRWKKPWRLTKIESKIRHKTNEFSHKLREILHPKTHHFLISCPVKPSSQAQPPKNGRPAKLLKDWTQERWNRCQRNSFWENHQLRERPSLRRRKSLRTKPTV